MQYFCFCNFRLWLLYSLYLQNTSIIIKITTFAQDEGWRILKTMSVFPRATPAKAPKTDAVKQTAVLYAVFLIIMAISQLFTFEAFIKLVPQFNLPLSGAAPYAVAPLLVAAEVFAVPFLLRMQLSPAFRVFSMLLGWCVAAGWFAISAWVVATAQSVETVGFLGTLASLTPGWWAVLLSLAFGVLAAWASWGMWPLPKAKK